MDLFKDVSKNKARDMYELQSHKRFLDYKMEIKSRRIVLDRIRIFLGLKLLGGVQLLIMILKRIDLSKEVFVKEIE